MYRNKLIEPVGFIVSGITALISLFLFYFDTQVFWGSVGAALLAALMMWMTYLCVRLIVLTFRE